MKLTIPEMSVVVLIGTSGSGKSTFAKEHFLPTEILSSDFYRGLVSDDENDQTATNPAFDVLHYILEKRLEAGKLAVIDATNVKPEDRRHLIQIAKKWHYLSVAVILNMPVKLSFERNKDREDRNFGIQVIKRQRNNLRRSFRGLKREGFHRIFELKTEEEVNSVEIVRQPLWNNKKHEQGPFDVIGDIHGCCDELEELLEKLGYESETAVSHQGTYPTLYRHPEGRRVIFVGDIGDRGPRIMDSFQLVANMVEAGTAFCVKGNHDEKLLRYLNGRKVNINHGLEDTVAELEGLPEEKRPFVRDQLKSFLDSLISHLVFEDGKLVVAHAGLKEEMHGRASGKIRSFALYGDTTGERDEYDLPVRLNWAADYRGKAMVVYGHTPVYSAEWLNNTINIDTGCVFGGKLTAVRLPEQQLISVSAREEYAVSKRPLQPKEIDATAQQVNDDMLDIADVTGKRFVNTRLRPNITLREENSIAALEVMSRFAVDPKWLIYLPPTMSPTETSELPDYLEHPAQAFDYFRENGVKTAVCEEKHMGSRAVVIVCKDESVPKSRFGVDEASLGIVYTRTGRRFFDDSTLEQNFLRRVSRALTDTRFWDNFETDWVCLDCELMPWSTKAQSLLEDQYAAVGASATAAMDMTTAVLQQAQQNKAPVDELITQYATRADAVERYIASYQNYCWPVVELEDLRLAPFHILATETAVFVDKTHQWHMEMIEKHLCATPDPILQMTKYQVVDLEDEAAVETAVAWWQAMTETGGEGMVVKPLDFIVMGSKGLVQPAVKCRGAEYLRIIYGPEYNLPDNIKHLRMRRVGHKRSMAVREFALGVEALERFVRKEPLRKVHECVFGVLAMECEPVDPRL